MAQILRQPDKGKATPAVPFRTLGAVALGDGAQLAVQLGVSGGVGVINLRNQMRQGGAGMCGAGPGALVGLDRVPDLIAILQRAVEPQAVAS